MHPKRSLRLLAMSSENILTKEELFMEQKFRVYIFCRSLIRGKAAANRPVRKLTELVGKNKQFLRPMLLEFGAPGLVQFLFELQKDGIFASEACAREVFATHFSRHDELQASETNATRSASEAPSTSEAFSASEAPSFSEVSFALSASEAHSVADTASVAGTLPAADTLPVASTLPAVDTLPAADTLSAIDTVSVAGTLSVVDTVSAAEASSQITATNNDVEMRQASQETVHVVPQRADSLGKLSFSSDLLYCFLLD